MKTLGKNSKYLHNPRLNSSALNTFYYNIITLETFLLSFAGGSAIGITMALRVVESQRSRYVMRRRRKKERERERDSLSILKNHRALVRNRKVAFSVLNVCMRVREMMASNNRIFPSAPEGTFRI